MKAIAINASPRMNNGNTALILNPFIEGMREEGAEVELVYARTFTINPCLGCFYCWLKKPGECCQRDDMDTLNPKLRAARDAGRQLVREGRIAPETLRAVGRELMPLESYVKRVNSRFHELLTQRG
ncbi:MAG: flavodoxin family protein [Candidatus Aureabacteria bacterium]|nr:flavodoxin family protein [Candidatus Auribacterota bacterium]